MIGPGTLVTFGTCVAETGAGAGFGGPAAGDTGARYLSMAGSTSGVPYEHLKKKSPC